MRLSCDKDSWRAGGVICRDARHDKSQPSRPGRASKKKKDTKRWCRGKAGVEHRPRWRQCRKAHFYERLVFACEACGKELDHWWGTLLNDRRPKPVVGSEVK